MTVAPAASNDRQPAYKEPVLDLANIQGNIVAGFNKDHQTLLYVHIDDVAKFRPALAELGARVTTAEAVHAFNLRRKQLLEHGDPNSIRATWVNIAFSFAALTKLADPRDTVFFADKAFKSGFTEEVQDRQSDTWKPLDGHRDSAADVLIIVAADDADDAVREVADIEQVIHRHGGVTMFPKDVGLNPPTMHGKEHFGYRDGISQPGLRGYATATAKDPLTPRPFGPDQGRPGQELIWPGEFVFGYPGQAGSSDGSAPGGDSRYDGVGALRVPEEWGKDGSYLVFRRFDQHVHRFHKGLQERKKTEGKTEDFHGARIVGRWRSGAPVMRTPDEDIDGLGEDENANNNFAYVETTDPITRVDGSPLNDFPPARADPDGNLAPLSTHIRRANPRDIATVVNRRQHRLLRRGIQFGEPATSKPEAPRDDGRSRGLLFLAYMTSIDRQFDGVNTGWGDTGTAQVEGVKGDALLGGSGRDGVPWISTTGGGNYFAPSKSAMKKLADQQ